MHDLAKGLIVKPLALGEHGKQSGLPGLGLTVPAAQATLLKWYRAKTPQGQWHTLPGDGYIHTHLTWHFKQANQLETLHNFCKKLPSKGEMAGTRPVTA